MSYKKQLKNELRNLSREVTNIVGNRDVSSISQSDRARVMRANERAREIESQLTRIKNQRDDYRGSTGRGKITAEDRSFTNYLRGNQTEYRGALDSSALSTAPNSAGLSAGATGYDAGYLIPQGFFSQLMIALKAYGGLSSSFHLYQTPTGSPAPWPTVDRTGVVGSYMTELNQLGFGGDSAGTDYQFGQGK